MKLLFYLISLLLLGCSAVSPSCRLPKCDIGGGAAVTTAHPLATNAARDILLRGGNAIDAAVTASFVLSVVRPQSTGIGGGGFMLLSVKEDSDVLAYDFRERAPRESSWARFQRSFKMDSCSFDKPSVDGPLAAAIPGVVDGLFKIHQEHGALPWSELVIPAARIAEDGFEVYPSLAEAIRIRSSVMSCFPDSKKIFLPEGQPLRVGDRLKQLNLAKTLRLIARFGEDAKARDRYTRELARELKRLGGLIDEQDLKGYQVKERKPVAGRLKLVENIGQVKVVSFPPPSSGGVHLIQMLKMVELLQTSSLAGVSPNWWQNTQKRYANLGRIMNVAFYDRAHYLGDPDQMTLTAEALTDRMYLLKRLREVFQHRGLEQSRAGGVTLPKESPETTHLSVVDGFGNAVSSTQTINTYFGSGVVAGSTGIVLNNEIDDFWTGSKNAFDLQGGQANRVAPGRTPLSSMTPTLVFRTDKQGAEHLWMVLGSPGGPRIISATFLTLFNSIFREMPLERAVSEPRIHHQWSPETLFLEDDSDLLREELESSGFKVESGGTFFGDVQAIALHPLKGVKAVSDSRSDGAVWVSR